MKIGNYKSAPGTEGDHIEKPLMGWQDARRQSKGFIKGGQLDPDRGGSHDPALAQVTVTAPGSFEEQTGVEDGLKQATGLTDLSKFGM